MTLDMFTDTPLPRNGSQTQERRHPLPHRTDRCAPLRLSSGGPPFDGYCKLHSPPSCRVPSVRPIRIDYRIWSTLLTPADFFHQTLPTAVARRQKSGDQTRTEQTQKLPVQGESAVLTVPRFCHLASWYHIFFSILSRSGPPSLLRCLA